MYTPHSAFAGWGWNLGLCACQAGALAASHIYSASSVALLAAHRELEDLRGHSTEPTLLPFSVCCDSNWLSTESVCLSPEELTSGCQLHRPLCSPPPSQNKISFVNENTNWVRNPTSSLGGAAQPAEYLPGMPSTLASIPRSA